MRPAVNPSWYAQRQPAPAARPALMGDGQAEVVVIGGGLAGISAALHLAQRGVEVTLLEASQVGAEASGRNGGQALQGLAASMQVVEAALGLPAAQAIWAMSREALELLKGNIGRFGIACELAENGYVYAACHAGQQAGLAAWQRDMADRYGYGDMQLLDADALRRHVASPAYVGGVYDPNEVHLDPLAYTQGLARAAEAAGVRVHEQSRVLDWTADGTGWRVRTATGSLRCRRIVLAVNTGVASLAPELARYFLPVESFIVATEPLPAGLGETLLPSGAAVADSNRVLNYFRLGADGRLLFGGRAAGPADGRIEQTTQRMLAVFPQLTGVQIAHAWGGLVDVPPNKLPQFGQLADGVYFTQGFCGHGLALTGLAGKLVAEAICGEPERFELFAALPRQRLPTQLPGFSQLAVRLGMMAYQGLDWLDAAWHRP